MSGLSSFSPQAIIDREHLKLLAITYYVLGACALFLSTFGLFHLIFGIIAILNPGIFPVPGTVMDHR